MTDRELLEAAAKAAGIAGEWQAGAFFIGDQIDPDYGPMVRAWNPLRNDGDALRLAVALELDFMVRSAPFKATVSAPGGHWVEESGADRLTATRRAIVRAAAAIGAA